MPHDFSLVLSIVTNESEGFIYTIERLTNSQDCHGPIPNAANTGFEGGPTDV